MIKLIQKATASSKDGAVGLIKGIIACAFQNMAFMLPTGLLYYLVKDLLGGDMGGKAVFYTVGCVICFALILITTWFQYNNTFFTTYEESGKRRLSLAERLRKLPLSFFRQKRPCRPHKYDYGGLRSFRKGLLALHTGAVRLGDFHDSHCTRFVCV